MTLLTSYITMEKDENQDVELEQQNNEEEVEQSDEETTEEKDWEAEAKKWQAIASRNKKKQEKKPEQKETLETDDDPDIRKDIEFLKQSEKKRTFGYEHGLSPEETDKIFKINPNPTAETLKDPFVKAGLDAIRRANRVDANTPSSSTKSNPALSKKFSELNKSEKDAAWQKFMKEKGVLK